MPIIENSELVRYLLRCFVVVVGRRTSENFAVVTLDTIINKLEPKYNFLQFIDIDPLRYSEGKDAVCILPQMNTVAPIDLGLALNEIMEQATGSLDSHTDYFAIREIKDELGFTYEEAYKKLGLVLYLSQVEYEDYIARRKNSVQIKNSEVVKPVVGALIQLLNRELSEENVMKAMIAALKKFQTEYTFLRYIEISDTPNSEGVFVMKISLEIDAVLSIVVSDAIEKVIEEIGKSNSMNLQLSFIGDLRTVLGPGNLEKIKQMNINLDKINETLHTEHYRLLFLKTLEAIVDLVSVKTSKQYAVSLVDSIIATILDKHTVLTSVTIDKSRYSDGFSAINVAADLGSVTSSDLGRAIKQLLKKTRENLGDTYVSFIDDFKKKIGEEYLSEMEKIGVNLFMIELKFI